MFNASKAITKSARAAILAIAISGTALAAAPAQAGGNNATFSFNFSVGNGTSFSMGEGHRQSRGHHWKQQTRRACMTNRHIRSGLRDYGFRKIRFERNGRRAVEATAIKGRWNYVLKVNRCSGDIRVVDRSRIRHNRNFGRYQGELHFQFR